MSFAKMHRFEDDDITVHSQTDEFIPDVELDMGDGTTAIISQATNLQLGITPRDNSEAIIGLTMVDQSDPDNQAGLQVMLTPSHAEALARAILRVVTDPEIIADAVASARAKLAAARAAGRFQ